MIDYTSPVGQTRLLIPDVEELYDPRQLNKAPEYIFTDAQINAFLSIEGGNVKKAAAAAKLAIATTEALILKVLTTDDKATDGAKLGAELRQQAKQLRAEAEQDEADDTTFMYIGFDPRPRDWAWH